MDIICGSFGNWKGYINSLNWQNAECVVLNMGRVYLSPEYSVLISHLSSVHIFTLIKDA
jgi:hypothetical protein